MPLILNFLVGIELNCCESNLSAKYAEFAYVEASSMISVKLSHLNSSINEVSVLSSLILVTLISTGNEPVTLTEKSFWYASAVLPVTVSVWTSVKPPELYWTEILNWTVEPKRSPSVVAFCICGNVIETFILSTSVFVICLVTGVSLLTTVPTGTVDWLLSMPGIFVWSAVPNLNFRLPVSWVPNWKSGKLKSVVTGVVLDAFALKIGVSLIKTSFLNAFA